MELTRAQEPNPATITTAVPIAAIAKGLSKTELVGLGGITGSGFLGEAAGGTRSGRRPTAIVCKLDTFTGGRLTCSKGCSA